MRYTFKKQFIRFRTANIAIKELEKKQLGSDLHKLFLKTGMQGPAICSNRGALCSEEARLSDQRLGQSLLQCRVITQPDLDPGLLEIIPHCDFLLYERYDLILLQQQEIPLLYL